MVSGSTTAMYLYAWYTSVTSICTYFMLFKFLTIHRLEPLNLPGRKTRSKNFKTPFFSRYQKILPWGNSNGSKTSPKFFWKNIWTNMVARGVRSFGILEGATGTLIEQCPNFFSQFSADMWWTNAENFKAIFWFT